MYETDEIASAIANENVGKHALQLLRNLVGSPELSRRVVEAVIARHALAGLDPSGAVTRTMTNLETLANKSDVPAYILMAHLWPFANDQMTHDVCDGIDLWLDQCSAPEVQQQLQLLARNQTDDGVRKHFEQLLKH